MKKFILLLSIFMPIFSFSQYRAEHILEVKRISNWAPDFLTVTNTWNGLCIEPMPINLHCMSVITSINGQSTEGMSEDEFYRILDHAANIQLEYTTKINGVNKPYSTQCKKKAGELLIYKDKAAPKPSTITMLSDDDIDYFKYCTYNYIVSGEEQLLDKNLMSECAKYLKMKGLKKVDENPDLYIYVTKDVKQNINSIYVPKYTTTTNVGTTSGGIGGIGLGKIFGGALAGANLNIGGSNTEAQTVTKEEGSMRTNVNADAYFEFSILDAKKMAEEKDALVWQMIYKEHATYEIKLLELIKSKYGSLVFNYPFHDSSFAYSASYWGLFFQDFLSSGNIVSVVPGSKAEMVGITKGSVLKSVQYDSDNNRALNYEPGGSFYAERMIKFPEKIYLKVPGKGSLKLDKEISENLFFNYIP